MRLRRYFLASHNTDLASDCTTIMSFNFPWITTTQDFLSPVYLCKNVIPFDWGMFSDRYSNVMPIYLRTYKNRPSWFCSYFSFFLGKFIIWSLIYLKIQFWFPYYLIHEFSVSFFLILLFQSIIPKLNVYWPTLIATYCIFIRYWPSRITCLLDANFVHLINVNFQ